MNWGMTMDNDKRDDQALDALFQAARANEPRPDAAFMDRLTADLPDMTPDDRIAPSSPETPWLGRIFAASGLSGAAILGLWIGFVMPEALDPLSITSDDTVALSTFLPGADLGAAFSE